MSTHEACIEAGIVKPPSPYKQIERLLKQHSNSLTASQKKHLREMLA